MNIVIEKIVYPGKSLAKIDGKVVFTDQGLAQEIVDIAVIKETKGYIQGRTTKIITPSPHRQRHRCDHYQTCSPYQYIDYPQQVEIKKEQIKEIISRQLKMTVPKFQFKKSPLIWGYRNKIKLKAIWENKTPILAYNLPETPDQFIPVDNCYLSPELTNSFLKVFTKIIAENSLVPISQLVVRENKKNELLICLYHDSFLDIKEASQVFNGLLKQFPVSGIILIDQKKYTKTLIWGDDFFQETIKDKTFCIGAESFFQINTAMLSILTEDLENNLDLNTSKTLADLYCAVGTFGILLASKVKQVIGIELEPSNFFFLEKNIKLNNIKNFEAGLGSCEEAINTLIKQKIDVVIVDPPRKGLSAKICSGLVKSSLPSLAYISCDPATLVRDLKILLSFYEIKNMFAYDFFPHTPHIEILVFLTKK